MKLRVRGDSLRYRLTQSEVTALAEKGGQEEVTRLGPQPGQRLVYRVEAAEIEKPMVHFTSGTGTEIKVLLPKRVVHEWSGNSEAGIYFIDDWGLQVAVEKDFRCLDPRRDEDESDHFDNPLAGQSQHSACGHESAY